jgi:hypothetical protein
VESLALDQAPLTRISGSGGRMLCGSVFCPQASDRDKDNKDNDNKDMDRTITPDKPVNRESILLPPGTSNDFDFDGRTFGQGPHYLLVSF